MVADRALLQEMSSLNGRLTLKIGHARILMNSELLVIELGGSVPGQRFEIWVSRTLGRRVAQLFAAVALEVFEIGNPQQVAVIFVVVVLVDYVFGEFAAQSLSVGFAAAPPHLARPVGLVRPTGPIEIFCLLEVLATLFAAQEFGAH